MEDFKSERADRERIHSELEELRERLAQSEEQIKIEGKQLKKVIITPIIAYNCTCCTFNLPEEQTTGS